MSKQLALELRPKRREEFYGNKGIIDLSMKLLQKNTFSHCVMLYGTNGVGKSSFAEYIAASLMCEEHLGKDFIENPDPCCSCPTCKRIYESNFTVGAVKKFNLPEMVKKSDVKDIITQIFTYESDKEKSVYILEEFQALKEGYTQLLEYLVKIPDDIYIIITTDKLFEIDNAIRNRCALINLTNLTVNDATQFVKDSCNKIGISYKNNNIAKEFAKCCNLNPRFILNSLDMLRGTGNISEEILDSLFNTNLIAIEELWRRTLDPEVTVYEYQKYIIEIAESGNILVLFSKVREAMIKNLMLLDGVEESNSEVRRKKELIKKCIDSYPKILEILEKTPTDNDTALSILTRAKLAVNLPLNTEKERCSRDMIKSQTTQNFSTKFEENAKRLRELNNKQ